MNKDQELWGTFPLDSSDFILEIFIQKIFKQEKIFCLYFNSLLEEKTNYGICKPNLDLSFEIDLL